MKRIYPIVISALLGNTVYASEALQALNPPKDEPTPINYQPQVLESLQTTSVRQLISALLEQSPTSLELLENPLKTTLINDFRVLFLAVFKEHLTYQKVPLESVVAGGFCANSDHLILLSKEPKTELTLWSASELLSRQQYSTPIDREPLILPERVIGVSPDLLKTSQKTNRFIIHDRCQQKVQVWHVSYKGKPTLVQERSVPLQGNHDVSLSTDGNLLSISGIYPVIKQLKDQKHRKKRKSSLEEVVERNPPHQFSASACISSNGCYLITLSDEGNLTYWDITSDKPVPLKIIPTAGQAAEALDATGKYLITCRIRNGSYHLWDCYTNTMTSLYKKEVASNPFTTHEPVSISHDGRFATLSLVDQDPVLLDLTQRTSTTLPLPSEPLKRNSINSIHLNTNNRFLLCIRNNSAYVVPLDYPMAELSLGELLLIIKLERYGAQLLEDPLYAHAYNLLPTSLKDVLSNYFDLPSEETL